MVKRVKGNDGDFLYYVGAVRIAHILQEPDTWVLRVDGNEFYYDSAKKCDHHLTKLLKEETIHGDSL